MKSSSFQRYLKQNTTPLPLLPPESSQQTAVRKKSCGKKRKKLSEGKGYYLYCQQHIMKSQVSKTWPEQQNILWIIATGDTFPYACNEPEDKTFVPQWNFHFSHFNPVACEARNKLYRPYQWRAGMENISRTLSRAKQTIACIIRSYWRNQMANKNKPATLS